MTEAEQRTRLMLAVNGVLMDPKYNPHPIEYATRLKENCRKFYHLRADFPVFILDLMKEWSKKETGEKRVPWRPGDLVAKQVDQTPCDSVLL
jgi:hypothetical protein